MSKLLVTVWNEPRAPGAQAPLWRDWLLVVAVILVSISDGLFSDNILWRPLSIMLSAACAMALPWRRMHPGLVVAVVVGSISVVQGVAFLLGLDWNGLDSNVIFYLILPYALCRWGSGRESVLGLVAIAFSFFTTMSVEMRSWGEVFGASLFFLFPAVAGVSVRFQDSTQRRNIEQLRLREREQLARELHDTVAHHISAIAIQAQAGQALAASRQEAPVDILATIEEAASRTLTEMRHIVQVLRDDAETVRLPLARLSDIERLAREHNSPLHIDVRLEGELDGLDATLEATLYRLTQESITNAVKHAQGAQNVVVTITGEAEQVHLNAADDGDPVVQPSPAGLGLRGMAERVALLGGTLHAAPGESRGWLVQATLPKPGGR